MRNAQRQTVKFEKGLVRLRPLRLGSPPTKPNCSGSRMPSSTIRSIPRCSCLPQPIMASSIPGWEPAMILG